MTGGTPFNTMNPEHPIETPSLDPVQTAARPAVSTAAHHFPTTGKATTPFPAAIAATTYTTTTREPTTRPGITVAHLRVSRTKNNRATSVETHGTPTTSRGTYPRDQGMAAVHPPTTRTHNSAKKNHQGNAPTPPLATATPINHQKTGSAPRRGQPRIQPRNQPRKKK